MHGYKTNDLHGITSVQYLYSHLSYVYISILALQQLMNSWVKPLLIDTIVHAYTHLYVSYIAFIITGDAYQLYVSIITLIINMLPLQHKHTYFLLVCQPVVTQKHSCLYFLAPHIAADTNYHSQLI